MIRRFLSFLVSRVAPWVVILLNVGFLVFVALLLFVFQDHSETSPFDVLDAVTSPPVQPETVPSPTPASSAKVPEKDTVPPSFSSAVAQDLVERSAFGFVPKRGSGPDRTPWQVYARSDLWPEKPPYATVSLVVEQMGMNPTLLDQAKTVLPSGVALAFNPYAEDVFSQMQNARDAGFETLLSLALETRNYPYSDPGNMALLTGNLPEKNQEMFFQHMATAQGYIGMIPMMGKIARYDAPVMDLILSQMTARGLMYVDAAEGTQAAVHEKRWKNNDSPYARVTLRLESIEAREAFFKTLAQTALKQGSAIGILPPYPIVFKDVKEWVKTLPQNYAQLTFVPLSYQGRLFLDAPKPEPEPEPEPAADPKKDDKKDEKNNDKKDKKEATQTQTRGRRPLIGLLGEAMLWLASLLAFATLLNPHPWMWRVQSVFPSVCFVILLGAFASSDVSLALVAESGAWGDTLPFRLASTWANHQGSLLLWWAMIGAAGFLFLRKGDFPVPFQRQAHRCHALLGFLMGTYLLFTGSPFAPSMGEPALGLNPLLHDQGLLIHPPILFAGYALTALVSVVACGLLTQPFPLIPSLMRLWRLTIALAWSVLGIGIGLGAWWAYRELGWGGWWFWDPVENASLLPWLVLTALLHAAPQAKTRQTFYRCALLYSFLAWTLCWLGTFLVRSGLLISVHSFVSDTFRGFLLLVMLMIHTVFLAVLWRRATFPPAQDPPIALGSRPFLMGMQNYLVLGTAALVGLGLFYPFFALSVFHDALSVGAGFYNQTVLPLMALSIGVLVFLPGGVKFWTVKTMGITLILAVILAAVLPMSGWAQLWALLPASLLVSVLAEARRVKIARTLGHLAMPLFAIAILGYGYGQKDVALDLKTNTPVVFQGETLTLRRVFTQDFPMYTALLAEVDRVHGKRQSTLTLARRHYKTRKTVTSEMTLTQTPWQDQGFLLAGLSEDGQQISVRVHIRPGMTLLWASFAMMGLGGLAAAWRQR